MATTGFLGFSAMIELLHSFDEFRWRIRHRKSDLEICARHPEQGLDHRMTNIHLMGLANDIGELKTLCRNESLKLTLACMDGIVDSHQQNWAAPMRHTIKDYELTYRAAIQRMEYILESFEQDVRWRYVFVLAEDKGNTYFCGFGPAVTNNFPSATVEIKEANKCFALELYTASVFHYMRAVERALHVVLPATGVPPVSLQQKPLSYETWGTLLTYFDVEAERIKHSCSGIQPNFRHATEFFSGLTAELYSFKDTVRDVTMHTRYGLYKENDAKSVMIRVNAFFDRLPAYFAEDGSKPAITAAVFA
jgi:hypothetical protein